MLNEITDKFKELYGEDPVVVRSPGRVNLIGEHTDYNEGFVLPAAINKEILFALAPNHTDTFRVYAFDLKEQAEFALSDVRRSGIGWANYLLGVIAQFQKANLEVRGFDLVFGGNVPIGAGLSSSAAVECGLAYGLNHLFGHNLERFTMVKMAQKAEHEYAGVMCGIMDQFASMFGKQAHVVKLDCRSLDYAYYNFDMRDYRIVLCDTQVKHSLASSEYNTRRQECEAGGAILHRHYPQVHSLRDVTVQMLEKHQAEFDPVVYRRCSYVVNENNRVEAACQDLEQGDMKAFGEKMYASHHGLQHNYEVSCPELDFLVEQAKRSDAVLGARMMGGGFGGCTINIVQVNAIDAFTVQMEQAYRQQFDVQLKTYIAEIVDGSSLVG
ncbi:galactokinase [Pontibacter ummariensis]|uniref:Galactokinase n=1 Tax=Pontibacter ummariensis TaxID=1610492 RepID=A0A239I8X5_9BACT|nr:galactokinase [Pontibacter ummariensis]PRY10004.1 galactokinase [Pontibacter ummariensis]SNS89513.1 galactokinase [Pontibacter ummariensis]